MSRIPAVLLQQFLGMSEYERTLAIDKISRELGITENEIISQLEEFQSGAVKPSNQAKPANSPPDRESKFTAMQEGEGSPKYLQDTHKYRFSYDPSHSGRKRQSEVKQAIACPNCNAALGIPSIRPITVKCPACMNEATFEN
ncbi:MAG: hypothetical protein VYA94_00315 [Candidatus Thermoplasmatota archaeon]|jgi:hypothetical protein|nr:hypothetical protein [Euryarchaeota archaeon]MEC7100541.1 hypothetical protein [Candidatus Thermoplasmatota archaeon]MEC7410922.1 hypothetical protein [Candidatus Thermoplasmatota archaeon]MEC9075310.1 hypothetical protein [Candidatus Thermoplasmatota archaeon]|tara:strand:+ start:32025 stop:32450 length:426 start_codon:yes stop_codon:yes gene_type:complete